MSVNILIKRSDIASKRPVGSSLLPGELALNYDAETGGLYYADTNGDTVKVGPCQVSATPPNVTPAGAPGNSLGEFWFNTVDSSLNVWNGTAWVETNVGSAVQGITGTLPITVDNTDPTNPIIEIDAASTTAPGAVQLNDTVTSTSTSQAATANAVKTAYDAATAAVQTVAGTTPVQVDNTDPQNLVVSVDAATTGSPGIVQLNNTTSSTSTTEALTANQGYLLQQQIDALVITNNLTLAGTYDASTGLVDAVTTEGAGVGFVVGDPLPTPDVANAGYFVIVDVQGSTGPTGTPPYHIGDWFLSDGAAYQFLNVGYQAAYASTSAPGIIQLATDAEVQAGTDTTLAVVPSSLQSKISDSTSTTSSTTIASSTAVKSAYDLANDAMPKSGGTFSGNVTFDAGVDIISDVGSNFYLDGTTYISGTATVQGTSNFTFDPGSTVSLNTSPTFGAGEGLNFSDASFLEAISDSTSTTSSTTAASSSAVKSAYDLANAAVPDSSFADAGDLLVGTGAGTFANLPAGPADYILSSDGTGNLVWVSNTAGDVTSVTGTSPITVDNTDAQNPVIGIEAASTAQAGAVQLYDDVDSTSNTLAATANAVKIAYDAATAASAAGLPTAGGTMTGNITFSTGTTVEFEDTAPVSISAADQLATVIDGSNGNLSIVPGFDAGTY